MILHIDIKINYITTIYTLEHKCTFEYDFPQQSVNNHVALQYSGGAHWDSTVNQGPTFGYAFLFIQYCLTKHS